MTTSFKFPPRYSNELLRRAKVDPIFVTRDPRCLNYIQNLRGICLFCDKQIDVRKFDFSICYQCEVWVLYSDDVYELHSVELGRAIQRAGAKKVLVVPFPIMFSAIGV
jgi:hypothetical protein